MKNFSPYTCQAQNFIELNNKNVQTCAAIVCAIHAEVQNINIERSMFIMRSMFLMVSMNNLNLSCVCVCVSINVQATFQLTNSRVLHNTTHKDIICGIIQHFGVCQEIGCWNIS